MRPRILVVLSEKEGSIEVPALIDSGCDTTVIPESVAKAIGLSFKGKRDKIYAYHEYTDVVLSRANITFLGKQDRNSVDLQGIPVLIALTSKGSKDEEDITLGIEGIFDSFDITFRKAQNRIIFKKVSGMFKKLRFQ
jgi:predicted aspartyl protease